MCPFEWTVDSKFSFFLTEWNRISFFCFFFVVFFFFFFLRKIRFSCLPQKENTTGGDGQKLEREEGLPVWREINGNWFVIEKRGCIIIGR